jgi:hypothetical protein
MSLDQDLYHELSYYTLAHPSPAFLHQHLVDAYAAQYADRSSKPIGVVLALIGLYLSVEKGFTGRQVQRAHMQLGKRHRQWPQMELPVDRGAVTIADVLAATPGPARDAMIHEWCASVWKAWAGCRSQIVELAQVELGIR